MAIHVKQGGTWREIANGSGVKTKVSGTWRDVQKVSTKVSGTWRTVWQRSDPVTYTYSASFCDNLRHGTSNAWTTNSSNEPHIGGFNGTYPYPYVGVIRLGSSPNGHPDADVAIGTRSVIKEVKLTLTRASGVGLNSSVVAGTLNVGTLSYPYSSYGTGTMATVDDYFDFSPNSTYDLAGWDYDQTQTVTIDPQHGYDMIDSDRGLIIASQTSGFTSTDTFSGYSASLDYMKFYDHNNSTAAYRPLFTIKFDYV